MAHEITKRDHMFAVGATPWHGLGTVLPHGTALSSAQAIAAARLDWEVALAELQTVPGAGAPSLAVPMGRAVVRLDTGAPLAVVGPRFAPLQNRDAFKAFDAWVDRGILRYETAGSLRGGSLVWILARLQIGDLQIGTGDTISPYALLAHGHDGRMGIRVQGTGIRVVCANTLRWALGSLRGGIAHRGDVAGKAAAAVAELDGLRVLAERQADRWRTLACLPAEVEDVARYLAAVLQKPMVEIIGGKLPTGEDATPVRLLEPVADAFESPRGGRLPSTDGTWWGVYQALTQVLTHGHDGSRRDPEARLLSSAWGTGDRQAERGELVAEILGRRDPAMGWERVSTLPTDALADYAAATRAA